MLGSPARFRSGLKAPSLTVEGRASVPVRVVKIRPLSSHAAPAFRRSSPWRAVTPERRQRRRREVGAATLAAFGGCKARSGRCGGAGTLDPEYARLGVEVGPADGQEFPDPRAGCERQDESRRGVP